MSAFLPTPTRNLQGVPGVWAGPGWGVHSKLAMGPLAACAHARSQHAMQQRTMRVQPFTRSNNASTPLHTPRAPNFHTAPPCWRRLLAAAPCPAGNHLPSSSIQKERLKPVMRLAALKSAVPPPTRRSAERCLLSCAVSSAPSMAPACAGGGGICEVGRWRGGEVGRRGGPSALLAVAHLA